MHTCLTRAAVVLVASFAVITVHAQNASDTSKGSTQQLALSPMTKNALNQAHKGWTLAMEAPQAASCAGSPLAGSSPSMVQADFNSDGLPDLALALKTNKGVQLVVVLQRAIDSVVIDVDSLGQDSASGSIGIEHQGAKFMTPDDTLGDYFPGDTLAVYNCGQPPVAYFWSGESFRKVQLTK